MSEPKYTPPKVWSWDIGNGGKWASTNRPVAGATHKAELPIGRHPLQLYSMGTPNGVKITVLLEELLMAGYEGAEYDAFLINIFEGEQFGTDFVDLNPNSKIPALYDYSVDRGSDDPIRLFESGAILLHLAEKFDAFIPKEAHKRAECLSWLFWQVGSAPYVGGGFGHFYNYAPVKLEYPIDRFAMESKRQMDLLDQHLAKNDYICGNDYTIADMAIWPWYGAIVLGRLYDAADFLDVKSYKHLMAWSERIDQREAVTRGRMVNRTWGDLNMQLHERHDSSDFELKTQDKLANSKK